MSLSTASAVMFTVFTLKSRCSSVARTQGSEAWRVIMFIGAPITGMPLISPMVGFSVLATRAMARIRSYSSRRSRCGLTAGIDCLRSSRDTDRPR